MKLLNKKNTVILCLIFATFYSSISNAKYNQAAIFGFIFGDSPTEILNKNIPIYPIENGKYMEIYLSKSAPKTHTDFEKYYLVFADNRLAKVVARSFKIDTSNDSKGIQSRLLYNKVKHELSQKYTRTTSSDFEKLQKNKDFYECLSLNDQCGQWQTYFFAEDKIISLKLLVKEKAAFIELTAESFPEWGNESEKNHTKEKQSNIDAL